MVSVHGTHRVTLTERRMHEPPAALPPSDTTTQSDSAPRRRATLPKTYHRCERRTAHATSIITQGSRSGSVRHTQLRLRGQGVRRTRSGPVALLEALLPVLRVPLWRCARARDRRGRARKTADPRPL